MPMKKQSTIGITNWGCLVIMIQRSLQLRVIKTTKILHTMIKRKIIPQEVELTILTRKIIHHHQVCHRHHEQGYLRLFQEDGLLQKIQSVVAFIIVNLLLEKVLGTIRHLTIMMTDGRRICLENSNGKRIITITMSTVMMIDTSIVDINQKVIDFLCFYPYFCFHRLVFLLPIIVSWWIVVGNASRKETTTNNNRRILPSFIRSVLLATHVLELLWG
mmetsp:Transcript_33050/g.49920  ORF Transcript_33050/g.49920 Transcript_33050/m.49920 type:complete len:217 (+) Transcript_33050:384-1034(+)